VDARGVPLSLVVTGANRNDVSELAAVLDARVVEPAPSTEPEPENLCADAGYFGSPAEAVIREHGYEPHVRSRKAETEAKREYPDYRPRRWVVEVSHSWFNRFRKLLVRYEKTLRNYLALSQLAAAIIAFRQVAPLYGPYRKASVI
jgi:transposase